MTQIQKLTKTSVTLALKSGSTRKFKAPKSCTELTDIANYLESESDCKSVVDFFSSVITADDYKRLQNWLFPSKAQKIAQQKKIKAAQKKYNDPKFVASVEKLQSVFCAQPGYLGHGSKIAKSDAKENLDEALQSYYGVTA